MVNVENVETNVVKLTVTVSAEDFNKALDESFNKANEQVEVKGFRKGHTPRGVFEREFGVQSLFEEAINFAINNSYPAAVEESKIEVVADPKIDFKFEDLGKDKEFVYTAEVTVKPEVKLGQYKDLEVTKLSTEVLESDVEAKLATMLESKAVLAEKKDATILENGDVAVFDFKGYADGEAFEGGTADNYELKIGSGQFIPGFEEQLVGMAKEETKDVLVTFPEDYQAENLKGKEAKFVVTLHEIKENVQPEMSDELAHELDETVNTVAELTAKVKAELETQKIADSDNDLLDKLVELAVKNAEFEVPSVMVINEQEDMMEELRNNIKQSYNMELEMFLQFQGMDVETYKETLEPQALKSIQQKLVLAAIANAEELKVDDEIAEKTYADLAAAYKLDLEEVKKKLPRFYLNEQLMPQQTVNFLKDNAKITD